MTSIWQAAVEQFEQGKDFVLATILSVAGSSPRHVGTRFLVRGDGHIVGTIGGGLLEADVQRFALSALQDAESHRISFSFRGKDAQSKEMICGGEAEVLVEFVRASDKSMEQIFRSLLGVTKERGSGYLLTQVAIPSNGKGATNHLLIDHHNTTVGGFAGDQKALAAMPETRLLKPAQFLDIAGLDYPVFLEWLRPRGTVYVFGAGHVGECVAHLAAYVGFSVVVVDDRSEFASPERTPDAAEVLVVDSFHGCFKGLPIDEESYIVIVTRGHAHDKTVLGQSLLTKAEYIGMIGSRRKSRLVFDSMLAEGFSVKDLERVHAPIGLPIGGETPQEIAVSIVAEMIQIRSRKDRLLDSVENTAPC